MNALLSKYLAFEILNIPVYNYCLAIILLIMSLTMKRYLSNIVSKLLFKLLNKQVDKKYLNAFQNLVLTPFKGLIVTVLLFFSVQNIHELLETVVIFSRANTKITLLKGTEIVFFFTFIFYITLLISRIVDFISLVLQDKFSEKNDKERQQIYPLIKDILKVLVWTLGIFTILRMVFNIDVTALVAGLGIGGIAVAFALKDSLENLLASILIMIDKPFLIGDWIKVNGVEGNVEKLGFRNTMIRSFDKTLISLPNKNLLNNNVENFSQRGMRRVKFEIGANYGLSEQTLRKTCMLIKEGIEKMNATAGPASVEVDRFGDSAIIIVITYYFNLASEETFAKVKEDVNYMVYNIMFTYAKGMPFPTTTQFHGEEINEFDKDA